MVFKEQDNKGIGVWRGEFTNLLNSAPIPSSAVMNQSCMKSGKLVAPSSSFQRKR